MMRNVLLLRSSSGFYGAENVIAELAKQLSYSSFHPIIGVFKDVRSPHIELAEIAEQYNLETKVFRCVGRLDVRTVRAIRKYVVERSIGIINPHGYKSNLYSLTACRSRDVRLVATCHPWIKNSPLLRFYARLDRLLLRGFDHVVAISNEVRDEILSSGVPEEKITIIDNGIDLARFRNYFSKATLLGEFGLGNNRTIIGTVGRLSAEKGQALLIEAAKLLVNDYPRLLFMITGDGPLRSELQDRVVDSGLQDHFVFTGVSYDIPKTLALLDIFVLPSLTEGLPMVLLEAMAAQKPVVAAEVGAIPRVVVDGKSGLLFRSSDVDSLADAIRLLLRNKRKASEIAQSGYEVVQSYSSYQMARKYLEVYGAN